MAIQGMSPQDSRAGDNRVLTGLAHGYVNEEFVGKYISPLAPVEDRTGSVMQFDDSIFELYDDNRAAGGGFNVVQTGFAGVPYRLMNKGLKYPVPIEHQQEAARANIQFGQIAQAALSNAEALAIEVEQMRVATNAANYPGRTIALAPASRFNLNTSTPGVTVRTALASTPGRRPNVILAGEPVTEALAAHPNVQSQFFQTDSAAIDDAKLAAYFGVRKYVTGRAEYRNPATGALENIWGKQMILAYVNPKALASGNIAYGTEGNSINRMVEPAAFYSYIMRGHPIVSNPFWDEDCDTWFYKIRYERQHVQAIPEAKYLLQTVVD
jgi:hypothetical protein